MFKQILDRIFIWYYHRRYDEVHKQVAFLSKFKPINERLAVRSPSRTPHWPWRDSAFEYRVIFCITDQQTPRRLFYASAVRQELNRLVDDLQMGDTIHLIPDNPVAAVAEMYCHDDEWVMLAKLHDMHWLLDQVIAFEKRDT